MGNQRWNLSISEGWLENGVYDIISEWKNKGEAGASEEICQAIYDRYNSQKQPELPEGVTVSQLLKRVGLIEHEQLPSYDIDKEIRKLIDIENQIREFGVAVEELLSDGSNPPVENDGFKTLASAVQAEKELCQICHELLINGVCPDFSEDSERRWCKK
jgi:hypothetical protein